VVIETQYIQTGLMVALTLFEVIQGGGPIYKSEADITRRLRFSVAQVFFYGLIVTICRVYASKLFFSEILRVLFGFFGEDRPFHCQTWFGR